MPRPLQLLQKQLEAAAGVSQVEILYLCAEARPYGIAVQGA